MKLNHYGLLVHSGLVIGFAPLLQGQSWQWGKRGGSNDNMNAAGADKEEVIDLVTDSQNNIYMISRVGKNKGHIKKLGRSYKFAIAIRKF